jgi:hypothetical protein
MTVHHAPGAIDLTPGGYSTSAIGAASELIACAELMRLGYHVYRCESPAAPFDLVVYRAGRCIRVEVKSVTFKGQHPQFSWPKNEWDLLVVVGAQADVFLFDAATLRPDATNIVRAHYGSPPLPQFLRPECGTLPGYERHRRLRESCDPCWETMRQYHRDRRTAIAQVSA